jgi:hypothetical protein
LHPLNIYEILKNSFASLGKKIKFPSSLQAMSSIQTYYQQIIFIMKKISNQNGQKSHNFEKKLTYLKCKVFIKATTNQQPLTKLQFIKQ